MRFKRLLALLVSAALALSLLAGCGGGKALSQVIVDLLDGLYANVSVEADSDLTAALKKAAAEGGTEEEILSRMIEILNLNNVSITFTRLGSGQQGDHAVTLYFQTGTDPDAAARNALAQWASTLGTLPDDGSFQADVAMIETENGYYVALDVEVVKAGKPDKPDKDDEPDDGLIHADGMAYDPANKSATISGSEGLTSLLKTLEDVATQNKETLSQTIGKTDITLESTTSFPSDWPTDIVYEAEFDGQGNTITGLSITNTEDGTGMFSTLQGGTVKNVKFENVAVNGGYRSSVVAGNNDGGTIINCHVLSGTISSNNNSSGGIAGSNNGTVKDCSVAANVTGGRNIGGIVGYNDLSGTITNCQMTGTTEGTGDYVGGITGMNRKTVEECTVTGNVTGAANYTGGIAGGNYDGTITNCTVKADVAGTSEDGSGVGGIVGTSCSAVESCHAEGTVSGHNDVGGVVGSSSSLVSKGSIINSSFSGIVTGSAADVGGVVGSTSAGPITACYAIADVTGNARVGGVAGCLTNSSVMTACYARGSITCTGSDKGRCFAGGVAGEANAPMKACYYAGGTVTSGRTDSIGGVAGKASGNGSFTACYWYGTVLNDYGYGTDSWPDVSTTDQIQKVTDWAEATEAMNAACGDLYDTSGTGAPKLTWE